MGGYERDPAPWGLDGIPRRLQREAARRGLAALRAAAGERGPARAGARGDGGRPPHQRAGGVHARRRVHPRARPTCAASGSPPASARTASRAPAGWGGSSPSGSSRACPASTSGRWTAAASATRYRSQAYTLARTVEVYSTYYDVKYPGHEREAGRPLRTSPTYGRLQELGAAFGEKSGWERPNWFEPNAADGDESLRPRGWAGRLWSAGDRRRAPRDARGGRALRRDELRQDRGLGRRAPRTSSSTSATTASRGTSARSRTRRC